MERQKPNEETASRILMLTRTETETVPGDDDYMDPIDEDPKMNNRTKKKDKKKKKKASKKGDKGKKKDRRNNLDNRHCCRANPDDDNEEQKRDEENGQATILSLGRAKPSYIQDQMTNNDDNEQQRRAEEQEIQRTNLQRNGQHEQRRPGAFRIFANRRANQRDEDSSDSSIGLPEQDQEQAIVTADVERLTRLRQEEQRELFEPEQEQEENILQSHLKRKEDDNFVIITAGIFGLLIIAAIVATIVLVRGSQDGNTDSNRNTSPTQAPGSESGNIFDDDLQEKWDGSDNLFLYAVHLGYDWSECVSSDTRPTPTISMGCSVGGTIGILGRRYFDGQGQAMVTAEKDKYACNNTRGASAPHQITCFEDPGAVDNRLTVIWIVGCVADNFGTQLRVESEFSMPTTLTCGASGSVSHSLSMGLFCFDESVSPPAVDFTVDMQCSKGEENMVGETDKDKLDIPFCGQFGSCQNGQCKLSDVDSIDLTTTVQRECVLSKTADESFLELMNVNALWGQLSFDFIIREFASNTHSVLTTP